MERRVRVAVNGYGVIGKRVAQAVTMQDDMSLAGVSDVVTDWRAKIVVRNGFRLFGATDDAMLAMRAAGLAAAGTLDDCSERPMWSWIAHRSGSPPPTSSDIAAVP